MKGFFLTTPMILLISLEIFAQSESKVERQKNIEHLKYQFEVRKEDTSKVQLLDSLAWGYMFLNVDTAIMYARKSLELAKKVEFKKGEANSLNTICFALSITGDFVAALDFGLQGLGIAEELKDSFLLFSLNSSIMTCYDFQGDYRQALVYGLQAKQIAVKMPSKTQGVLLGVIGSIYEKLNQTDSSLAFAFRSFDLIKTWSGNYLHIGDTYAKKGFNDSALYYYRSGIPIAIRNSVSIDIVDIYNGMSKVFEAMGEKDSSLYYANKAIMQGVNYPQGELKAVIQLAHIYDSKGIKDSAIKYLKLSIVLNEKLSGRQKIREAQNVAFNRRMHQQELESQKVKNRNEVRIIMLVSLIALFLILAFLLWVNNRKKQKTNLVLHQQKNNIQNTLIKLKSTQAQLIHSEKMASLGELTAGIAHEIQNPLNFVNNFSEVNKELLVEMKDEMDKGNIDDARTIANEVIDNEEKINHHGKRADAIVKGMLQHSRISTGQKEPTDINALADEYLRLSYHGLRAKDKSFNAEIKTDFDEAIGKINIVPQGIGRVLLNLYNNAFYAVTEKKKQQSQGYEPTVSVSTKKINDKIEIRVKDNGNGIPQKVLGKIFQPFFTTKPTGQGTGLGLSLSYDIVKAHGGEIKVETKEGAGSEFIISLPEK